MPKKKILIVSRSFYPMNSPRSHRTTELAKEFARAGHEVTVLTPKDKEHHPDFEKEHQLTIKDLGKQRWNRFDFGKSKIGSLASRGLNRLLQLMLEYPNIELFGKVKRALKQEQGYDLLISIAVPYPVHWGVAKVWNKSQKIAKVWIADCGDPFMGNTTDSFKKWFYFKYVEKWFMRKADFITIPVEGARQAYYPEFHDKIKVIPQGFKIIPLTNSPYQPNDIPTFAYAGGLSQGFRDPQLFLEYLTEIDKEFKFLVYTRTKELLLPFKDKLGEKLEIRDYIPREDLLKKFSSMDFLVNFDNNTPTALPSKLIDYKLTQRPVLNIKKILDKANIDQFLSGEYQGEMQLPSIENYKIEHVCESFLHLYESAGR